MLLRQITTIKLVIVTNVKLMMHHDGWLMLYQIKEWIAQTWWYYFHHRVFKMKIGANDMQISASSDEYTIASRQEIYVIPN